MESETFRVILLTIFIPFSGYKVYKFFKKLYKLSEPSFKEKLEKYLKFDLSFYRKIIKNNCFKLSN